MSLSPLKAALQVVKRMWVVTMCVSLACDPAGRAMAKATEQADASGLMQPSGSYLEARILQG